MATTGALTGREYCIFPIVLAWKVLLFAFALPVPSNDSFFYDGAVVNYLTAGTYANPSLALALPISGTQVFSAYPPLYQALLLPWMWTFGTSAWSAMGLHLVLFSAYTVILWKLLAELRLSPIAVLVSGLFLFSITFHDRPDSLAHVLGLGAVYAWARSLDPGAKSFWSWLMAAFGVLALSTGLQIGALYFLVLWSGNGMATLLKFRRFAVLPMVLLALVPVALVAWVMITKPVLWAGFLEHARQTPSLTGFRIPKVDELAKMIRTVPGVLGVVVAVSWLCWTRRGTLTSFLRSLDPKAALVGFATLSGALIVIVAAATVITPNSFSFVAYIQPVIVAVFLSVLVPRFDLKPHHLRILYSLFIVLAGLGSLRAVGLSTWGIACAVDCGRTPAADLVKIEAVRTPPLKPLVVSSAYLYGLASLPGINAIHCDWMQPASKTADDFDALLEVKPARLFLTQFDYFRRFEPLIARLSEVNGASVTIQNYAHVRAPDSFKPLRRVVQHLAWAPVIISIDWK